MASGLRAALGRLQAYRHGLGSRKKAQHCQNPSLFSREVGLKTRLLLDEIIAFTVKIFVSIGAEMLRDAAH